MTTYAASLVASNIPTRRQEKGVYAAVSTYEFAGEAADSVVQMVKVGIGTTVQDGYLIYDALGGTNTTIDVGDADVVDRYIDGAVVDAAAGLTRFNLGAGGAVFPYTYAVADTVDLTLLTDAATGTATLVLFLTNEEVDLS